MNLVVSLYFFYTESSICYLDDSGLYNHVQKTSQRLGLPMPARSHVKRIGDGTVFIKEMSCHQTVLNKLKEAKALAGELRDTEIGLISISCLYDSGETMHPEPLSHKSGASSSPISRSHPSQLPPQLPTRTSNTPEERTPSIPVSESHAPQNISRGADEPFPPSARPRPLSYSQVKASKTARLPHRDPSSTLPPKPSWAIGKNPRHKSSQVLKPEPMAPLVLPVGNPGSSSALSAKELRRSRIDKSTPETQTLSSRREREIEEDRRNREYPLHKRRRLENGSPHSPQQYMPADRDPGLSASLVYLDYGTDGDQENMQSLRRQVSDLEKRVLKKNNEADALRQELDEERRKRVRAELIVDGIRRETSDPFIVPSLLDAFITVTDTLNGCLEDLQ